MKKKYACYAFTSVLILVLCCFIFPAKASAASNSSLVNLNKIAKFSASSYEDIKWDGKTAYDPVKNAEDGDKDTLWISDGKVNSWFKESWEEPQFVHHIEIDFQQNVELFFKFEIYGTTPDGEKVVLLNMLDNTKQIDETYEIDVPDIEFDSITIYFDADYPGTAWPQIADLNVYGQEEYKIVFDSGEHGKFSNDGTCETDLCCDNEEFPSVPTVLADDDQHEFVGWEDENGNVIEKFPEYVTENMTYTALWKEKDTTAETTKDTTDKTTKTENKSSAVEKTEKNSPQTNVQNDQQQIKSTNKTNIQTNKANQQTSKSEKVDVPQTGDEQNFGLYIGLVILSAGCIFLFRRFKSNK